MAKYIDLPNLKENLTNFLNKKINPIYAKKTEIPSNVSELNNDKSYQTAEEVGQAVIDGVARIVAGAPEDFDTLKEMSDWISSHETSAAAMNSAISDNSVAIANHTSNSDIHVTKEEKTKWNKLDSDLKDGTIIVAEATKATQDAQGNTIDTTYAKKTEVPQGTVVDDALSSTSVNPVQNKVVKAEFDKVNSNLDKRGYGENTGSGNLFREEYKNDSLYVKKSQYQSYLKTNIKGITKLYATVKLKGTSQSNYSCSIGNTDILTDKRFLNYGNISIQEYDFGVDDDVYIQIGCSSSVDVNTFFENYEIIISDSIITSDTQYKPYIPSVKMLADENAQQNESLSSLGKCKNLLKPTLQTATQNGITCTNNGDGTYTLNGTATSKAVFYVNDANELIQGYVNEKLRLVGSPKGSENKTYGVTAFITPKTGNTIYYNDYGEGKTFTVTDNMKSVMLYIEAWAGQSLDNLVFKPMLTTNLNATYDDFVPYTGDGDTLTADVAKLNSDLSNIKDGTTPVAKAVADEDGNNIKSIYAKKTEAFVNYSSIAVDLNTLTTAPSLISIGYDVTNKPSNFYGGYMFIVNAGYTASIALYQILFDVFYNKTYQRKYYHGSWSAWSDITTPQDIETTTLTTTSGTATLYKLGKMRHLVLNNATFSSTTVLTSTDASVGTLYFRAEVLFNSGDDLEGAAASFEDICISGSNIWNATKTATGASPVAIQGATGSATWIVQ